jgi:hypothetical protein
MSYRLAGLHRLAKLIPWNRFLGYLIWITKEKAGIDQRRRQLREEGSKNGGM